jgi:hypothetical protein
MTVVGIRTDQARARPRTECPRLINAQQLTVVLGSRARWCLTRSSLAVSTEPVGAVSTRAMAEAGNSEKTVNVVRVELGVGGEE